MRNSKILAAAALTLSLALPAAALEIVKGPYLQNVTQTSIVVMWETDQAADSTVEYGLGVSYGSVAAVAGSVKIHEVTLSGLAPDTAYHYRVRSGDVTSADAVLRTAVRPGTPFRFAVYGDSQSGPPERRAVIEGIISARPRIVLHVGDTVSDGLRYEQWQSELFGPSADLLREVPLYIAIGNHERNSPWFYDFVSYPPPENYYSFDYGSAHFVMIDTNQPYHPGSPQYQWLEADLASDAAQQSDWLFAAFHAPPYSEGWDSPDYDGEPEVREYLLPLLEKYGVDMVFNGHTHDYERGFYNGIYYIITGGGGGALDRFYRGFEHIVVSRSAHHYCIVDLDGPALTLQAISAQGEVIDRLVVRKRPGRR